MEYGIDAATSIILFGLFLVFVIGTINSIYANIHEDTINDMTKSFAILCTQKVLSKIEAKGDIFEELVTGATDDYIENNLVSECNSIYTNNRTTHKIIIAIYKYNISGGQVYPDPKNPVKVYLSNEYEPPHRHAYHEQSKIITSDNILYIVKVGVYAWS